jgi:divalent metal cation (Fe/Co/Zn/Cd) transporter
LYFGLKSLRASHPQGSLLLALRRSKDPAVFTVVTEDIAALAGLLAAFIGVLLSQLLHSSVYDALGSIAVGAILMTVAVFLASESRQLLVGESGGRRLIEDVKRLARAEPDVVRVGDALSMHLGPDQVLLNLDVEFSQAVQGKDIPAAIQRLERHIKAAHPQVSRLFVEASSLTRGSTE